jgi:hypothetical protein
MKGKRKMDITIETKRYNERRYGKPWIAKVDFSQSTKGDFSWGDWTGDHYNGGEGVLTLNANPGDIIATGQKDFRKPAYSAPYFYVVAIDGELQRIGDKGAAYKYYLERKGVAPDRDALRKERETLAARIAEIDALLGGE